MKSKGSIIPERSYRLVRNFAVLCAVVLAVAAAGITKFYLAEANRQLSAMAESNNSDLGRALSSSLWPHYGMFVNNAYVLGADEVRMAPRTAALAADVKAMVEGSRVLKVKIYDQIGFTVFSTDPSEIGDTYANNPRFRLAASGRVSSALEFRPHFDALGRPMEDRWVLSSYVPVAVRDDTGGGVFEIYSDVTNLRTEMRESFLRHSLVASAVFLIVFVLLLTVVWRADRALARQEARNLTLAASAARAEAASRSKSEFLANMSHELRTPLNAIIGFSEVIASETVGPLGTPVYRTYAQDISGAGKHLLAIINDVLDLARVEAGTMTIVPVPFDASETAGAVIKMLHAEAAATGHALVLACGTGALTILGDPNKTRQILINLISNAIKFTPRGGVVRVNVTPGANQTVVISVADTGIGIREEDIPVALSAFGQVDASLARRFEGSGLGLTLSQKFAELMGGTLAIASAHGKGTTVTVTMPAADAVTSSHPTVRQAG